MSAASRPTTGHLTTASTPHWPAHVSDSCLSDNMKCKYDISIIYIMYFFSSLCLIGSSSSPSLCLSAGCDCQSEFTDGTCEDLTGRCFCKPNYAGENCDSCASGFINFPDCYRESQTQKHKTHKNCRSCEV